MSTDTTDAAALFIDQGAAMSIAALVISCFALGLAAAWIAVHR